MSALSADDVLFHQGDSSMWFMKKKVPFYLQRKWQITFGVVAFLLAIRIILPSVIKVAANRYLKNDFSPSLTAHIDDIDLAILRGVYSAENISVMVKKNEKEFLSVKQVDASLAWRELFKGNIVVDITVDGADANYFNDVMPAIQKHAASLPKEEKKESPVRLSKFDIKNSVIRTELFPTLTREEGVVISEIEVRATNVTANAEAPLTPFSFKALLLGSGQIKVEGDANLLGESPKWTVDSEVRQFDLTSLNRFLKKTVPLTFTKGKLDLYAEATSEGGPIRGYIKPFVKGLDVIRTKEKFVGTKHWLIEIITALGNVVMKSDQTMATRVPFVFDKEFKPEGDQAITKAIEHGFMQELTRGIENSYDLKDTKKMQSQEER